MFLPMPRNRFMWEATAHTAAGLLVIDDLRQKGLLEGGPEIDSARCNEILALAAAQDILVSDEAAAEMGATVLIRHAEGTW